MHSSNRRKPGTRRVVATGVASIALLGLAMGPVGASTTATPRAATFSAVRQAMLHAETVDADKNELDELQTMIDVDQNDVNETDANQTDTETGDVAETPAPDATPEVDAPKPAKVTKVEKKALKVEKKAAHKVAVKNAQSDNDDNGDNNNNDEQNGNQDNNDKHDGESNNGGHHDGGHDDNAPTPAVTTTTT
jgi:hypothetical protein